MDSGIATLLEEIADAIPDRRVIVHGGRTFTWAQFEERAARLATVLADLGVIQGSRIGVALRNSAEFLEVLFAAFKLRASPVSINYRYRESEVEHILTNARIGVVVHGREMDVTMDAVANRAEQLRHRLRVSGSGDGIPTVHAGAVLDYDAALHAAAPAARITRSPDDEFLQYTGGTTGRPKGVRMRQVDVFVKFANNGHRQLGMAMPQATGQLGDDARRLHHEERSPTALPASPLMHSTGLYKTFGVLMLGGTAVFCGSSSFDADEVWALVQAEGVTDLAIVGDVFGRPLVEALERAVNGNRPYDVSTLRRVTSSGAIWSSDVKQAMLEHVDATLIDVIGSTEGGPFAIGITERSQQNSGSTFRLAPHARVIDDDGRDVVAGSGDVGVLMAPAPPDAGYEGESQDPHGTFVTLDGGRYVAPGDLATITEDGELVFLGRKSGVINTGGEKVYPEEVRSVLLQHHDVEDAVVLAAPDPRWGETVAAVVVRRGEDTSEDELADFVGTRLAGYKKPRMVVFVPALKLSPAGKVDGSWAREVVASAVDVLTRQARRH